MTFPPPSTFCVLNFGGGGVRKPFQVRLKGVPDEFILKARWTNLGIRGANGGTYGVGGNTYGEHPNSILQYYHKRPPTKDPNFSSCAFNQHYYLSGAFQK